MKWRHDKADFFLTNKRNKSYKGRKIRLDIEVLALLASIRASCHRSLSLNPSSSPPRSPAIQLITMADHEYKFNVSMSCGGCSGAIERVLKKLEGRITPVYTCIWERG